jgi:predicted HicB family RNase H-like nuclease
VRLSGQDPELVYVEEEGEEAPAPSGEDGLSSRITLRLPDSLKASVERAAETEGASVNAWIVRALQRAVSGGGGRAVRSGKRITGFSQA